MLIAVLSSWGSNFSKNCIIQGSHIDCFLLLQREYSTKKLSHSRQNSAKINRILTRRELLHFNTPNGSTDANGENTLGTQITYAAQFHRGFRFAWKHSLYGPGWPPLLFLLLSRSDFVLGDFELLLLFLVRRFSSSSIRADCIAITLTCCSTSFSRTVILSNSFWIMRSFSFIRHLNIFHSICKPYFITNWELHFLLPKRTL